MNKLELIIPALRILALAMPGISHHASTQKEEPPSLLIIISFILLIPITLF